MNDDLTVLCRDYNARVGNRKDYIETVGEIPGRVAIDNVVNDHDISLLNFLLHTKTCIVNETVNSLEDGFTSVSHRDKAVVDYFITTHEGLDNIEHFKVINFFDLITGLNLQQLYVAKVSDHSMLLCDIRFDRHLDEYRLDHQEPIQDTSQTDFSTGRNGPYNKLPPRYKKVAIPNEFLSSEDMLRRCEGLIEKLLDQKFKQEELDNLYDSSLRLY